MDQSFADLTVDIVVVMSFEVGIKRVIASAVEAIVILVNKQLVEVAEKLIIEPPVEVVKPIVELPIEVAKSAAESPVEATTKLVEYSAIKSFG